MRIEQKNSVLGLLLVSLVGYILMGYFIPRTDFFSMITIYSVLFAAYIYILTRPVEIKLFKILFVGAILFRVILLFTTPMLSDDFYRFFWDGEIIHQGINPYTHLPSDIAKNFTSSEGMRMLYDGMNSKSYFSVYPPMAQFSYYLATFFTEKGIYSAIIIYKILILIAELALFKIFIRFLEKAKKPTELAFVYFLNPLIILEFSGNLHGEIFVILALMSSMWFLLEKRYVAAALIFGLAISFKLLPLIFLPLIIRFIGVRAGIQFVALSFLVLILTFIPFIDSTLIHHITESIGLYFNTFEFNSSISNLVRFVSKWLTGSSYTPIVGKVLGMSAFLLIIGFSLKPIKQNAEALFQRMSLLLLIYLLFAMSIHPWYITPIIAFGVLIPLRYGIVWSYLIFFTYITYMVIPYQQNSWLISFEYLMLLSVFLMYSKKGVEFT